MIPEFIKKFVSFIGKTVKKIVPNVKKYVLIGIGIVKAMQGIADNPALGAYVRMTATIKDDAILAAVNAYLPKLLASLQMIEKELTDAEVSDYFAKIDAMQDKDAKAILLHGIASAINNHITPDIGSIGQSFITTEVVYKAEQN